MYIVDLVARQQEQKFIAKNNEIIGMINEILGKKRPWTETDLFEILYWAIDNLNGLSGSIASRLNKLEDTMKNKI